MREIAAKAWNAVRGDDPEFDSCILTHQQNLIHTAEGVQRADNLSENATAFEQEVWNLLHPKDEPSDQQPTN